MSKKKDFMERSIECPRCWVTTERRDRRGIAIDVCPNCEGLWLDTRELMKLLKDSELHDHLTKYIGTEAKSKLICPRCGHLMNLERAKDVEVDVCIRCRGIWLDKGELGELGEMKGESHEKFDAMKEVRSAELKKKGSILDRLVDFFYYR